MKKLFKKVRFVAGTIIKGGLKTIPLGNAAVKIVEHFSKKDLATGELNPTPINWQLIIVEIAGIAVLTYLVLKGIIPVEQLIKFLNQFI